MQALLGLDLFLGAALIQSSIIPCTCGFKMQKQLKWESLEIYYCCQNTTKILEVMQSCHSPIEFPVPHEILWFFSAVYNFKNCSFYFQYSSAFVDNQFCS